MSKVKMKKRTRVLLTTAAFCMMLTGCEKDLTSSDLGGLSSQNAPHFDQSAWKVTADSDIFNGGKILGGTVCDYLNKVVWGGNQDWDCLGHLRDNGMNWVRVGVMRQSNSVLAETPFEEWGSLGQRGWSTLEYAEAILRDAEEKGFRKNLFFFLSTQNAYSGHQPLPGDWKNLSFEELCTEAEEHCYTYTKYFMDKGIQIDLYDIGNEIQEGILGHYNWEEEAVLLKACIKGVKRADPGAKINLHGAGFGYTSTSQRLRDFYQAMVDADVPFDVAGVSYYWQEVHIQEGGTHPQEAYFKTEECMDFIRFLTEDLGKKFIFSEYVYQYQRPDNISAEPNIGYPLTLDGQRDWIRDFLKFVYETPEVSGCLYFYPEYYPSFQQDARYRSLNAAGLFTDELLPNAALKEFKAYKNWRKR